MTPDFTLQTSGATCLVVTQLLQFDLPLDDVGEGFSGTDGGYFGHSEFWFYGTAQPDGGTGQTLVFNCATPDGGA